MSMPNRKCRHTGLRKIGGAGIQCYQVLWGFRVKPGMTGGGILKGFITTGTDGDKLVVEIKLDFV